MQIEDERKAEIANMPRRELNAHAYLLEKEQEEYEAEKRTLLSTIEGLKKRLAEVEDESANMSIRHAAERDRKALEL